MIDYKCGECGVDSVKLWRMSHIFLDYVTLRCVWCAIEREEKLEATLFLKSDAIGGHVPAVPAPGETFWGYTPVPLVDVRWWYSLPTVSEMSADDLSDVSPESYRITAWRAWADFLMNDDADRSRKRETQRQERRQKEKT